MMEREGRGMKLQWVRKEPNYDNSALQTLSWTYRVRDRQRTGFSRHSVRGNDGM